MSDTPLREFFGTFDGLKVVCEDGRVFPVPANYASKSKLVVGDGMKAIVTEAGLFFKQVKPVERKGFIGKMVKNDEGQLFVQDQSDGKCYSVLEASVSFFDLCEGDEVVAKVPKNGDALWAAIEACLGQSNA